MGSFLQSHSKTNSTVKMKVCLLFLVIFAAAICGQIKGEVVACKSDADCSPTQCCVSYKTGGTPFCRGILRKGDDCDLQGTFAWCPCEKGLTCVDSGNWPIQGVIGKCR